MIRAKLAEIDQSQVKHCFSRFCLSSAKVVHHLRVHGETLAQEEGRAKAFDELQRGTLDRLFPGLHDEGYEQAGLSVGVGGLGMRQVEKLALPASIASRVSSRPKVNHLAKAFNTARLIVLLKRP